MTLRTITYDDEQWQVVPKKPAAGQVAAGMLHTMSALCEDEMVGRGRAIAAYMDMLVAAPEPPAQEPMTNEQIMSACYTYRHDFGLLPHIEQQLLMAEARRWADAFGMEVER